MGTCGSKPTPRPNPYARKPEPPPLFSEKKPSSTPNHLKDLLKQDNLAVNTDRCTRELEKTSFGFNKDFASRYQIVGKMGHTCSAVVVTDGKLKGQKVAVKIIPKSKMTICTAMEDVRKEVNVLLSLTGHPNIVKFYGAFEDVDNVYTVTEMCQGQGLLERMLSRGGKYSEDQAKSVVVQILNAAAFLHLQGIVHRDLRPENFRFASTDDDSHLRVIDFGSSTFLQPGKKLHEIVGNSYYVAPEVLHGSYSREADVWCIGVIAYILLCGVSPFRDQTESGFFQEALKANPSFDDNPRSEDFIKKLLDEDPRRRLTAAQALCHPWIRNHSLVKIQLDILVLSQMEAYMRASPLRKAALRALSTTLTQEELFYLKGQFTLLCPGERRGLSLENMRTALMKNASDAIKSSFFPGFLASVNVLQYRKMFFEEFCAAALTVEQVEAGENWEERARSAYDDFERNGNRAIAIEEVVSELGLSPRVPVHTILQDWIRHSDGKLSFKGYVKLLHGSES